MSQRRRHYGIVWLPPMEGAPLEQSIDVCLERAFRPMAFWAWGGPECRVLRLAIDLVPLIESAPAVQFPAPIPLETVALMLQRATAGCPGLAPLEVPSVAARSLFSESHHVFERCALERFDEGAYAELQVTGSPFEGAAILGDWWT